MVVVLGIVVVVGCCWHLRGHSLGRGRIGTRSPEKRWGCIRCRQVDLFILISPPCVHGVGSIMISLSDLHRSRPTSQHLVFSSSLYWFAASLKLSALYSAQPCALAMTIICSDHLVCLPSLYNDGLPVQKSGARKSGLASTGISRIDTHPLLESESIASSIALSAVLRHPGRIPTPNTGTSFCCIAW